MSTQVQYRRGTEAQNNSFVGALAEITVDTTNLTLRVHDGITAGGSNIATVSYVDAEIGNIAQDSISNGTSSVAVIASGGNVRTNIGGSTISTVYSSGIAVTGLVSATTTITATGNVAGGNLTTAGQVSATGNITGGNLKTASVTIGNGPISGVTTLSASGNANVGNLGAATVVATTLTGTLSTAAQTNITSVGTLGSLTVTGNITGGNLITAGLVSLASVTKTGSNGVGNIGSSTSVFNTVFAKATSAQYADLAEKYQADRAYPPGTVLEIGGSHEVTQTTSSRSIKIAGVVSTDPAFIMNSGALGDTVVQVALLGRVPCRIIGTVKQGDLLCSSHVSGVATALSADLYRPGSVIGKALADYNSDQEGMIEILVGRL